jgi:chromodomain-helicase-DNA-binding protein 7
MVLRPRRKDINFHIDDESEEESEEEIFRLAELQVINPTIESIHCQRIENGKNEFFVKFQNLSFHHAKWMKEEEILTYDPNVKKKLKRFIKDFEVFLESGKPIEYLNFDRKYLNVDRIINCSEMFPIIHPKKASQIKNQWTEILLEITRHLVNFENQKVFYGIHLLNLCEIYPEFPEIQNFVDFSVIINRIYLDDYKTPSCFWKDVLQIFDNFEIINGRQKNNDRAIIIYRLREAAKSCFRNWKNHHRNSLEEMKVFFRSNYSESEFNAFLGEFYKLFSSSGNNTDKFFQKLKNHIDKYKLFLPNYDKIQELLENVREKGINLEKLLSEIKVNQNENQKGMEIENIEIENDEQNEEKANDNNSEKSDSDQDEENKIDENNFNLEEEIEETKKAENNIYETSEIKIAKDELKKIITEIQILINQNIENFQILFKKMKNPNLKLIYGPLDQDLGILLEEGPLDFTWVDSLEDQVNLMNFEKKFQEKFFIKWKNLSYLNSTWENKDILDDYEEKIQNFYRFNRALLKEARKEYLERYEINMQLAEIKDNSRKSSRQQPSHIFDLRKKLFGFKEMKNVFQYNPKNQPTYKNQKRLRDYQLESLNWMINAWTKRRNIIIADEMGLGKTIQAMSFINHLVFVEKMEGPFLIIAPLSTLQHWKRVFLDWSYLNSILYYDGEGKNGRAFLRENEWYRYDVTQKGNFTKHYKITKFQVLITSFEVFIQDFETVFRDIPFQHIIIDEAHRLKNKNAKIISILKRLVCNRIFLLTGTPIQNNITELWSLLNFIEPNHFDDLNKFKEKFGDLTLCDQLENLKTSLKPYLLRRMKEDVETSIPPLTETIIDIELTNIQKMVYKTVYEKSKGTLQKGLGLKFVSMMNNLEIQLRKCCNHPFLLNGIKENLLEGVVTNNDYYEKLLNSSGKMIFLDKMISKYQIENKKILIFSQFTEMLKIIEEYLNFKNIHYEKIDGSTKAKDRQGAIDRFNSNPDYFEVFLLSTKAGGIGINLTSAKIVIIYDSDWNPQNDVQAIARAHRIGQTEEVKVFRIVSKKTYESEMFERSSKKLGLDQAIFLSKTFTTGENQKNNDDHMKLKPKEIELLLRKGMLGLLEDEKGKEEELVNLDVDEVIKNARVANYSFTKGSYSFAKGNFTSTNNENKVLLDDPDFWKKVFINSDTNADKIVRKYEELKKNKMIKILNQQKEFFLELSSEIFNYMTERMKNEGYCEDTERKFNELLQRLEDSADFHPVLNELIHHLAIDFKKQSRRIKKYDEKYINSLFRKRMKNDKTKPKVVKKKETSEEAKEESNLKDIPVEKKELKIEKEKNNKIFYDSGSDFDKDYKIKKKKNKVNKIRVCDYCYKDKPDFICNSFCEKAVHRECLAEKLAAFKDEIEELKKTENIEIKEPKDNLVCDFCRMSIAQCFDCKKISKVENNGKIIDHKNEKAQNNLYKCKLCSRFYHFRCLVKDKISIKKKKFTCSVHICNDCGETSDDLYVCQECPMSFHKKCLSKRNRIIGENLILCYNHKKSNTQKIKNKKIGKKSQEKITNILDKKKKKLIKASSKSNKKLKTTTEKSGEDVYTQMNLQKPEFIDYSKFDQVN